MQEEYALQLKEILRSGGQLLSFAVEKILTANSEQFQAVQNEGWNISCHPAVFIDGSGGKAERAAIFFTHDETQAGFALLVKAAQSDGGISAVCQLMSARRNTEIKGDLLAKSKTGEYLFQNGNLENLSAMVTKGMVDATPKIAGHNSDFWNFTVGISKVVVTPSVNNGLFGKVESPHVSNVLY